jgi:hypothetical protein
MMHGVLDRTIVIGLPKHAKWPTMDTRVLVWQHLSKCLERSYSCFLSNNIYTYTHVKLQESLNNFVKLVIYGYIDLRSYMVLYFLHYLRASERILHRKWPYQAKMLCWKIWSHEDLAAHFIRTSRLPYCFFRSFLMLVVPGRSIGKVF